MGLDTSHNCWHGSYGGFKLFRDTVAEAAKEHYDYEPEYEKHPPRAYLGWWDSPMFSRHYGENPDEHSYSHPLDIFFIHSDCEGWIFPHDAGVLADALEPLVGYLEPEKAVPSYASRERLWDFINGLRQAHEYWDVVEFH